MKNQSKKVAKTIIISEDVWIKFKSKAILTRKNIMDVINDVLKDYTNKKE